MLLPERELSKGGWMSRSGTLTHVNFETAAKRLNCEPAALKAVAEVEAPQGGFLPDGRPRILFEAHIFSKLTGHRFDDSHPEISSPKWNQKLYKGSQGEWDRLSEAVTISRKAALMSASWGKFQILGRNYGECGFETIEEFVNAQKESEERQLEVFVDLILEWELDDELQRHDWAEFARIYNGKSYRANQYDVKLAAAYKKFASEMVPA